MEITWKQHTITMGIAQRLDFARTRGMHTIQILPVPSNNEWMLLKKINTGMVIAKANTNILVYSTDPKAFVLHSSLSGCPVPDTIEQPFLCFYRDEYFRCFGPDKDGSLDRGFRVWLTQQTTGQRQQCCVCLENTDEVNVGGTGCVKCSAWLCAQCYDAMPSTSCPVCRNAARKPGTVLVALHACS
jgi:hypothetical protein